jgi:hypothetical protein
LSSILRALKRIETDTAESPGIQSGPGMSSAARVRENFFIYKCVLAAAIVLAIVIGSVFLIKKPSQTRLEGSMPASVEPAINNPPAKELTDKESIDDSFAGKNASRMHAIPAQNENVPAADMPISKLSDQLSSNDESIEPPGITGVPIENKVPTNTKEIKDEIIPEQPRPLPQENPEIRNWSGVDELDQSAGLDLQAISWAADPQKRLAVINGTLCRENESINGYIVKQINPDDVILSRGSVVGKLVLKIR